MDVSFGVGGEWTEITIDSAAEESVCPQARGKQFWMGEVGKNEFGKCQWG